MGIRRLLLYGLLSLLLVLAFPQDRLLLSPTQRLASSSMYNLVGWEIEHFLQKWRHRLWTASPFTGSPKDQDAISDYFELAQEIEMAQRDVERATALSPDEHPVSPGDPQARLGELRRKQDKLRSQVEEALEGAIGAVLAAENIPLGLGPIKFPPVDFTFAPQPTVLVTSPRNRILRLSDTLLNGGIPATEREVLEERILRQENLSALVEDTGGLALYPAIISPTANLHEALVTASHEWLHHFFYFRPLGQGFYRSPEMMTLNESAADLLGQEVGDRAYELLTGQVAPPRPTPTLTPRPSVFNFQTEMWETRLRVDELLAEGKVEEAERYMEERRRLFVANGYSIRKLNQAYFAFHGTYADSPASVSPIAAQLRELRSLVPSLGRFARLVSGVGNYDRFLALLESARAGQFTRE